MSPPGWVRNSFQTRIRPTLRVPDVLERQGRTFLEFAIKTGFVLDPSKTFCCSWIFSGVLQNSWTIVKLFIIELLITLNLFEHSRIKIKQCNWTKQRVDLFHLNNSILNSCVVKKVPSVIRQCLFEKMCYTNTSKKYSKYAWNKIWIITKRQNVLQKFQVIWQP